MAGSTLVKDEKDRRKALIGMGFFLIIAVFLLAPYSVLVSLQKEQQVLFAQIFGVHAASVISSGAQSISNKISSGFDLYGMIKESHGLVRSRLDVIALGLYVVFWRLIYFFGFVLICSPLLIAAVIDGITRRRISQWRYEYTSSARHYFSRSGIGWFVDLLLGVVVLPIPLPPVAILLFIGLLGFGLRWWAASMQKRM